MVTRYIVFLFLILHGIPAGAQHALRLNPADTSAFQEYSEGFRPKIVLLPPDTLLLPDSLCAPLLRYFREKGFPTVSIDTPAGQAPLLSLGPLLRWVSLRPGAEWPERWWAEGLLKTGKHEGKPLSHTRLLQLESALLEHAENNGYPFATLWLDSLSFDAESRVSAVMRLDPGRFYTFNSLMIKGDLKLPAAYLPRYLGIRPGQVYSRARVLRLREQLRSLQFVESTANPLVRFTDKGEANLTLFLQKKRAGRFDFIIGILPRPGAADGRLLLTGSLNAAFQNALNLGEYFSAELERLRPETQKADIQLGIPYLLGSAFGAEGRLSIFRRDSTWTDANTETGVSWRFTGGNFARIFWENRSSALQRVDTLAILASRRLPAVLDFKQNGFGLETAFSDLDYRFNPRRGWALAFKSAAGFHRIRRNTQIERLSDAADPAFSFASLYDSLNLNSTRFRLEARGEWYVPLWKRSTLKLALQGGGIFANQPVYANEQYRLGGNKRLRGFDEESLFATRFLLSTLEWRLLLGPNSFLSAFTDWAYLENITVQQRLFLRPLGIGAGLNFETKAGIFGITIAAGRSDAGQAIDLRATKFHLGYVSLF